MLGAVVGLAMLLVLDWLLAVASAKLIVGGAGAGAGTGAGVGVCAGVGCWMAGDICFISKPRYSGFDSRDFEVLR